VAPVLVLALVGCGGGPNPDREVERAAEASGLSLDGQGFTVLRDSGLLKSRAELSGDGAVEFLERSPTVAEDAAFAVEFSLPTDSSALTLWFAAPEGTNDSQISQTAVGVRFRRSQAQVEMDLWNRTEWVGTRDSTRGSPWLNAERLFVVIDVHNSESPAHLIVWPQESRYDGRGLSPSSAWFNSAEMSLDPAPRPEDFVPFLGTGSGVRFGLAVAAGAQVFRVAKSGSAWDH
jgi:hypothetical protein